MKVLEALEIQRRHGYGTQTLWTQAGDSLLAFVVALEFHPKMIMSRS